jgi:hypothetical protein
MLNADYFDDFAWREQPSCANSPCCYAGDIRSVGQDFMPPECTDLVPSTVRYTLNCTDGVSLWCVAGITCLHHRGRLITCSQSWLLL